MKRRFRAKMQKELSVFDRERNASSLFKLKNVRKLGGATVIIVDDLALPVGALRLKGQGSDGGHNGLKHIATILGTTNYARLRFGIGNDFSKGRQVDFVLGTFDSEEQKVVDAQAETVGEIIKSFCFAGLARTMNQFNKKGVGKE